MSFLYRRLVRIAAERCPRPLIAGVVERGDLREFSETVLLERMFRRVRSAGDPGYFNRLFGRRDLTSPKAMLDRLGYTDALLLAMLLEPGQYTEPWTVAKYEGLRHAAVVLPGDVTTDQVDFAPLKPGPIGFPAIRACYLQVSDTTEPIRIEVFQDLSENDLAGIVRRTFLYARLLPGYGFPVGLDIADKFAHVPNWLTDAYSKLVRHQLGVSLQRGEITDAEMRRILVQAIYMTHRDWLFRPQVQG
jgi:hypothetical protein